MTFLVCAFAVWRATRLLQREDGPWNAIAHLRMLAVKARMGRAIDCFYCLSLWIAIPFAVLLAHSFAEGFCVWLGLSGAAILVQSANEFAGPPRPVWREAELPNSYEETQP